MSETYEFQAETQRLLHLMIHSLYTNKEIFLRELISNSSDALDRLRFEAITQPELVSGDEPLEIRLDPDSEKRTLTVHDNGIGMSREEVIANIGTIAKSGTRELMEKVQATDSEDQLAALIGQFGVGFYSSFMVADRVILVTRRAGEEMATRWESAGDGRYELDEAERDGHGTSITLHLKESDGDDGLDDFTEEWTLKRIVKRYSDFVTYPIRLEVEREKPVLDDEGKPVEGGETKTETEDLVLNSMKPIWTRSEGDVEEAELKEFYRHISHDWSDPMLPVWLKAEGRFEYQALLFVPGSAPFDLYYVGFEPGLQLYVRRVLIMERSADLLPRYLRFIKGVVEASDLPLNVSRELLQHNRQVVAIRKGLVRKVLDTLRKLRDDEPEKYLAFWKEFGRALKEGVDEERDYRDRVIELLMFETSEGEELTTLAAYVSRMPEDQEEIFYLTGESREAVAASPHLEAFHAKGIEVLYLVDPVDELMVQSLTEYDDKKLRSVGKGAIDLSSDDEKEEMQKELEEKEKTFEGMLEAMQKHLDEHVKQVRLSGRLTSSPACLVGAEHDYSPQLEKLLMKGKGGGAKQRRILELNPDHAIVQTLRTRFEEKGEEGVALDKYADLLFGYATLAEGSELVDPVRFNSQVVELMEQGLG
ncbi:MAG: molecular chaperone HtpG [Acidobacteriota bacterium]